MKKKNLSIVDAIQIATGLALVIGLIMVFIELRQTKVLSLAELTSAAYAEALADYRSILGENPAPIIAKSCFQPSALEPEEFVVLDAFYSSKIAQVDRVRILEVVADFGVPWKEVAAQQLQDIVMTEPGKTWLLRRIKDVDSALYEVVQTNIARARDCKTVLASKRSR